MNIKYYLLLPALCLPHPSWAGVYKCTDADGNSQYQSSPCTEENKAVQINTKTGSQVDLDERRNQQLQQSERQKQLEAERQAEEQARLDAIALRRQLTREQQALTQNWIQQHSSQFSAYAIPTYDPEKLPELVKAFENRLPDIEKLRRLAAQKALATGQCQRVEADELNAKSSQEQLVFLVNCGSGASFYFTESELTE